MTDVCVTSSVDGANTALVRQARGARGVQVAPAVVWVERRGTHDDLLHRTVAVGMAELRRVVEEADRELPQFVWKELERYLGCGDPQNGFAWLVCERCEGPALVQGTGVLSVLLRAPEAERAARGSNTLDTSGCGARADGPPRNGCLPPASWGTWFQEWPSGDRCVTPLPSQEAATDGRALLGSN